jgi:uncharacterized protein YjdB
VFRASRQLSLLFVVSLLGCFKPPSDMMGPGGGQGGGGAVASGPVALSLQPAFLTLPIGSTAQLQVFAQQSDGSMTDVTAQAQLAADPAGLLQLSTGSVTALAAGSARLTATLGALSATGGIEVPKAALKDIAIDPSEVSLGVGQTQALTVLGHLADDTQVDLTASATFSSSNPALLTVEGNVAKALATGDVVVTATAGGFNAQAHLSVRPAKVVTIAVMPAMAPLAVGGTLQLSAVATYDDARTADVTASAAWTSSNAAVSVTAAGLAKGVSAGTSVITAAFMGINGTANLTVTMAQLTAVSVDPVALTLPPGSTRAFTATGHYSDGSTADLTAGVQWSSSAPTVASVSNASGHQGQVTTLSAGGADIIAKLGNAQGQSHVTVTPATLSTLAISPATAQVRPGGTTQLTVKGTYSDGSMIDLTPQATWTTSDPATAVVGNAGQGGRVSGIVVGSVTIKAAVGSVFATATVTVARQNPVSIEVAPSGVSVQAGKSIALRAMAHYADGLVEDASEAATWQSSSVQNATVSNVAGSRGLVHAVANGMATITATIGMVNGSAQVTVSAPTMTGLVMFPPTYRVPAGTELYPTVSATYSDGTTQDMTSNATWTTSSAAVAKVDNFQGYTYVTAVAPGVATITAKLATGETATMTITVTNATVTAVQITPAQQSVPVGTYLQLQATGVFSDLTTQDESYSASWTSSDPTIATVSSDYYSAGTVTTNAPGTVTISANFNGVVGTTTLTVTSAQLMSIQVTPFAPRLPKGFDTYLRATGIYSDNTTQELTYLASWTSGDPTIAAVSGYGDLQPLAAGMAQVNANYLGVTGSTLVTVTNATLQGIAVTPNMSSIAVGAEQPLTATGTFSDATMMDVTPYVTWLSSNKTAADVSNAYPYNGQAKGLAAGTTTISAIRGSVTGTASLTVH